MMERRREKADDAPAGRACFRNDTVQVDTHAPLGRGNGNSEGAVNA